MKFLLFSLFLIGASLHSFGQLKTPTINAGDELSKSVTKNFLNQLNLVYSGDLAKIKCRNSKKNQKNIEKKVESLLQAQKDLDIAFLSNVKNSELDSTIKSTIEKNFSILKYLNSREKKIEKIDKNLHYVISLLENSSYDDYKNYVIKTNYHYLSIDTINRSLKSKSQDLFINYKEVVDSSKASHVFDLHASLDNNKLTFTSNHLGESKEIINGTNRNLERLFSDFYQINENKKDHKKSLLEKPIALTLFNGKHNLFIQHYYNRKWRVYNRPNRLTVGINTSYNLNTGFLTPTDFSEETQSNIDKRLFNEIPLNSIGYGFNIGYSKRSNSIELTVRNTVYGFNTTTPQNIDWNTGYISNDTSNAVTNYRTNTYQLGLQYRFSYYYNKVSPYFAGGLNFVFSSSDNSNISSFSKNEFFGTNINLGLGLNIHPAYCWDIHIAPITNLFLTPIQGTKITTRFSSLGIEIGMKYNIPLGLKQCIVEQK